MEEKTINCPSCGAQLKLKYRFSKMVGCPYCGQNIYLTNDGLTPVGDKVVLADYGSVLGVGKTGKIKDQTFEVLGRMRFDYEDGFWDEWILVLNGNWDKEYWLQEDEGDYVLFSKENIKGEIPAFSESAVGVVVSINTRQIFIAEKNTAKVNGGEGELPFQVQPGEQADFIDGISYGEGLPVSIEYMPGETALNIGKVIELSDIKISN